MTLPRLLQAAAAVVVLSACSGGQVQDTTGPGTPVDTTGGGTIQRGTLTVRVSINALDQNVASTAGVTVQGLAVRIARVGSSEPPRSAQTDATGAAQFTQLLQGTYTIAVDRPLTPSEIQQLPAEDRDISIFAAGGQVTIAPPSGEAIISLVASRRGSVILSEISRINAEVAGGAYPYAHYFEVYNNGDTTVYLDGMLLFRRAAVLGAQFPVDPCETVNVDVRLDPDGIWASLIFAFPGTGQQHPLQPGEAQVIALDATDHSSVGLPNLSRAHFEIIGTDADPNNPSAADMIRIRGTPIANNGHGEHIIIGSHFALALPVARDTTELLHATFKNRDVVESVFRIPRHAILDAVGTVGDPNSDVIPCIPYAAPHFERSPTQLLKTRGQPMRRKSLGRTADGREILQRTGNADRDFELAQPLRRSLDK